VIVMADPPAGTASDETDDMTLTVRFVRSSVDSKGEQVGDFYDMSSVPDVGELVEINGQGYTVLSRSWRMPQGRLRLRSAQVTVEVQILSTGGEAADAVR
jgi:hypothetical protein